MTQMITIFADSGMKNKKNYSVRNRSLGKKCHDASRLHPVKDASLTGSGVTVRVVPILPSDTSLTGCKMLIFSFLINLRLSVKSALSACQNT